MKSPGSFYNIKINIQNTLIPHTLLDQPSSTIFYRFTLKIRCCCNWHYYSEYRIYLLYLPLARAGHISSYYFTKNSGKFILHNKASINMSYQNLGWTSEPRLLFFGFLNLPTDNDNKINNIHLKLNSCRNNQEIEPGKVINLFHIGTSF